MLAFGLAALLFAASPSPEAVKKAADAVLASKDYQRELPDGKEDLPSTWKIPSGPLAIILRVLCWTAVGVAALLLGLWVARALRRYVRDAEVEEEPAPAPADLGQLPLAAAEALAAQRRFGEAVHVLLLRTLEVLSRNLSNPLSPAFTSREVLERIPLRDSGREALSGLVSAVEVSHFGGSEVTEADYQICLDRFRRFAVVYREGA